MVDICLVTWFRPELSYKTIETIYANTKRENYRLIVIDNGSKPTMQRVLEGYKADGLIDVLVLNQENKGLEPARNQGLKLIKSKYFICADSDCLPQPIRKDEDWVEKLIRLMDENQEYAAIACRAQVMI